MSLKSSCYLGIAAGLVIGILTLVLEIAAFTRSSPVSPRALTIALYLSIGLLALIWIALRTAISGSLVAALGCLVASGLGLLTCFGQGSVIEVLIAYAAFGLGHGFIAQNHLLRTTAWLLAISALLSAALLPNDGGYPLEPAAVRLAAITSVARVICLPCVGFTVALAMHRRLRGGSETMAI